MKIDITPTWSALIHPMIMVLRNPDADQEAVDMITQELMKIAEFADRSKKTLDTLCPLDK